jgi:N-acetylglucosaminyldiphosphoundecaprenol N-acetyl-beta-D-mannosaminyltransferase
MMNVPDLVFVWVGLGTPKRAQWVAGDVDKLNAPVMLGVGAAFGFFAGTRRQVRDWVHDRDLKWLFRLLQEPRHHWNHYLIGSPVFLSHLFLQGFGLEQHPLEA